MTNESLKLTNEEWRKVKTSIGLGIVSIIAGSILTYLGIVNNMYGLLFFSVSFMIVGMFMLIFILFNLEHEETQLPNFSEVKEQ